MMPARFLIRFDDMCPTMNWTVWEKVEAIVRKCSVKPILAIVPRNKDPLLEVGDARSDFWERARQWQEWGWTIGLHGFRHVYDTDEAGLIGLNPASEFSGHPRAIQEDRIAGSLEIFRNEGIKPSIWIAPGHSFDELTIEVLRDHGINLISDGFFLRPARSYDTLWVPQQLWRFYPFPFGLWTVCYHLNEFQERDIASFERDIHRYLPRLTSLERVISETHARDIDHWDKLIAAFWLRAIRLKGRVLS